MTLGCLFGMDSNMGQDSRTMKEGQVTLEIGILRNEKTWKGLKHRRIGRYRSRERERRRGGPGYP